jgi:hypothetical protein
MLNIQSRHGVKTNQATSQQNFQCLSYTRGCEYCIKCFSDVLGYEYCIQAFKLRVIYEYYIQGLEQPFRVCISTQWDNHH